MGGGALSTNKGLSHMSASSAATTCGGGLSLSADDQLEEGITGGADPPTIMPTLVTGTQLSVLVSLESPPLVGGDINRRKCQRV